MDALKESRLPVFQRIAIVGVGLIGGSVGLGLKSRGGNCEVVGVGHRKETIDLALELKAIDRGTLDLTVGVSGADLVILAAAVSLIPELARRAMPHLKPSAVLTDVGSTKVYICSEISRFCRPDVTFVGGHPLAGSEKRGVRFAKADLFRGCTWFLTPAESTREGVLRKLKRFCETLGARVATVSPPDHDRIVAATSHLPHLVAAAIVGSLEKEARAFIGPGFKDATRIAGSDSLLWRDIFMTNRAQVLKAIERFEAELARFKQVLEDEDPEVLEWMLREAASKRSGLDSET